MGERTMRLGLAWGLVAVLAGCGAKESKTEAPGAAAIGSAGGTVTEPGGASVVVPPGAFEAETPLRIAKDSTGAPTVPEELTAAGDTYVITPHGGSFAQPVEVRIPAPGVTLQPNEELKLATAEPGGEWEILGDTSFADGVLGAQVSSFSYFIAVKVSYPLPVLTLPPLNVETSLSCGGQPCEAVVGGVTGTLTVTTNGGQVPSNCGRAGLAVNSTGYLAGVPYGLPRQPISFAGGQVEIAGTPGPPGVSQEIRTFAQLECFGSSSRSRMGPGRIIRWARLPAYPGLEVTGREAVLFAVEGQPAVVKAVLLGGAAMHALPDGYPMTPTPTNRAVIDWERSDDAGASWQTIGRSYQDEADSTPDPGQSTPWALWSVHRTFVASAADQGARIRVHACYTPPDVPALPCVTGPVTRINVVQQSALPAFTDLPRPVLVTAGQSATFTATAGGAPAPSLQWQTRAANDTGAWTDVTTGTGATTGSYTTALLSIADNGQQYRVVATSALGRAESPPVTASVSDVDVAPAITTQPADASVAEGSSATFSVTATGTELGYQWLLNGLPIADATGPSHTALATTLADGGAVYAVLVYNGAGVVQSHPAVLTVTPATVVARPPQDATLAAGFRHTCAIKDDATLACWGSNSGGQLGNGSSGDFVKSPFHVPLEGAVTTVAAGSEGTCAIHGAGDLSCWGNSDRSPVLVAGHTGVLAVSVGTSHRCFVSSGGAVYCWGSNSSGQLGDGTTSQSSVPVQALGAGSVPVSGAVAVTAGLSNTCALKANGTVLCWGGGVGSLAAPVPGLADVTALAQGALRPCALSTDQLVRCWSGAASPTVAAGITGVTALASGSQHTCAAREDGSVWCWGTGLMGNGNVSEDQPTPTPVAGLSGVMVLAAGLEHTCGLRIDGSLTCWGANGEGQLGTGDTVGATTPTNVPGGATWLRP